MSRMLTAIVAATIILGCATIDKASAGVIIYSLPKNSAYNPSASLFGTAVSPAPGFGLESVTYSFLASQSGNVSQIDLQMWHSMGPNGGDTVSLFSDNAGSIGSILGSWTLGPIPAIPSGLFTSISGISGISLYAGEEYWLGVTTGTNTLDFWVLNNIGVTGTRCRGNGVCATPSTTAVFQITGTSIPEPVTLSVFGVGLAGAISMRRRKKAN